MSFELLGVIAGVKKLQKEAFNLLKTKDQTSSDEFINLVKSFEQETNRLNQLLIDQFGHDNELMQLIFELKSVTMALKQPNVETKDLIS